MGDFVPQPTELWGVLPTALRAMWDVCPTPHSYGGFCLQPSELWGILPAALRAMGGFAPHPYIIKAWTCSHLQNAILHVIDWHILLDALLNAI